MKTARNEIDELRRTNHELSEKARRQQAAFSQAQSSIALGNNARARLNEKLRAAEIEVAKLTCVNRGLKTRVELKDRHNKSIMADLDASLALVDQSANVSFGDPSIHVVASGVTEKVEMMGSLSKVSDQNASLISALRNFEPEAMAI